MLRFMTDKFVNMSQENITGVKNVTILTEQSNILQWYLSLSPKYVNIQRNAQDLINE